MTIRPLRDTFFACLILGSVTVGAKAARLRWAILRLANGTWVPSHQSVPLPLRGPGNSPLVSHTLTQAWPALSHRSAFAPISGHSS